LPDGVWSRSEVRRYLVSERRVLLGVASAGKPTTPFIESLSRLKLPRNVAELKRSVAIGNYIRVSAS